jgi:hypothetical protein
MRRLLAAIGFAIVLLETRHSAQLFPTSDAVLRYADASSFGNFLSHLPPSLRSAARDAVGRALAEAAAPEGIRIATLRIVVVAKKPPQPRESGDTA